MTVKNIHAGKYYPNSSHYPIWLIRTPYLNDYQHAEKDPERNVNKCEYLVYSVHTTKMFNSCKSSTSYSTNILIKSTINQIGSANPLAEALPSLADQMTAVIYLFLYSISVDVPLKQKIRTQST